jgi:hypothetical protein
MKTIDTFLLFCLDFFHFLLPSIILIIHTIQIQLVGQVILTEVMFDADTLESHNEFVEIYNLGEQSVSLEQWWLGDGSEFDLLIDAGFGLILHPQQFALILDPSYFENSTTYDSLIPENTLILTIDDGSFGSYGWSNTISEPVILISSSGDTVQSYSYSLDNSPGFSDEKIILSEDNSGINWGNSRQFRGTPGTFNSVMASAIDLAIDSLWIDPAFPNAVCEFNMFCLLKNLGVESIFQISVEIYHDLDFNFQVDPGEMILQEQIAEQLVYSATIQRSWTLPGFPAGNQQLGILATVEGDTHSENNQAYLSLRIDFPESPLVINEIMYRPLNDKPEWVELYNKSTNPVDLTNWYFADARDTIMMAKDEKWIAPERFMVLCEDSSLAEDFGLTAEVLLVSASLPSLNNDYDDIKLLSFSKHLVDRVIYSDSWMRRETEAGVSLERIHPDISSSLPGNWAASTAIAGATPGQKNSIYVDKPVDNTLLSINPNPFSPDADGFEDFAIFEYHLPFATGYISIDIFDSAGRRIRRLAVQQPVGPQGNFIWDGTDDSGRICRIGIYIVLFRIAGTQGDSWEEIKKTLILMKRR